MTKQAEGKSLVENISSRHTNTEALKREKRTVKEMLLMVQRKCTLEFFFQFVEGADAHVFIHTDECAHFYKQRNTIICAIMRLMRGSSVCIWLEVR